MIEVINGDDVLDVGFINLMGRSMPGIGVKRGRGSIKGVAFNDVGKLDEAIAFLQRARSEVYGEPTKASVERKVRVASKTTKTKTARRSTKRTR